MTGNGRKALLQARDVPLIDTFQVFGPSDTPATASFKVIWEAIGPEMELGAGTAVDPTDPAAFLGRFREARATGIFSGFELGFSFESNGRATTEDTFAMLGTERNGSFLG